MLIMTSSKCLDLVVVEFTTYFLTVSKQIVSLTAVTKETLPHFSAFTINTILRHSTHLKIS